MIKLRARSMKAAAVVAIGFFFAAVGATAASASNANQVDYWQAKYPNVGECVKYDPPSTTNSYGSLGDDGKSVVLTADQALLIVKGGSNGIDVDGNNVFVEPKAGVSYQSPSNGGGNVPAVSHWIVCEYKTPPVVEKTVVSPQVLTTDKCDADNATLAGIPAEGIVWSEVTTDPDGTLRISASLTDGAKYTFGDNQTTFTFKDSGVTCEVDDRTVVRPDFPAPIPPTCVADGQLPEAPDDTEGIAYTWEGNTLTATAGEDYVFPEDATTDSRTYDEPGSATGYQSSDAEAACYTPQPEMESGEEMAMTGQCADGAFTTVITRTPWTRAYELNTATGGWSLGDKVRGESVVTSSVRDDSYCEVTDRELAEVDYAPTWTPICLPNNDTVTFPEVDGVTYTDTGWDNGQRTITASAEEGIALLGETSWTFTDTPAAECPDEQGNSFQPSGELAYSGPSSSTGGLAALAALLVASGAVLVTRKMRA